MARTRWPVSRRPTERSARPCKTAIRPDGRQGGNSRKDEEIGTFNPSMHDLEIFSQRKGENGNQEDEQSDRQIGDLVIGGGLDVSIEFSDQPTGAKKRVAETQSDAAKRGKRAEPAKVAAGVFTVCDRKTLYQSANRHALVERRDQRAAEKAEVPDPAHPLRLVAKLERHTAKDQS